MFCMLEGQAIRDGGGFSSLFMTGTIRNEVGDKNSVSRIIKI